MILYSPEPCKDPFGLFKEVSVIKQPSDIQDDGVLILWGGEDIGTSIYHQIPNNYCSAFHPSKRDRYEMACINHAIKHDIPIIGICRGAQLLCAMAGGSLMQHIEGHGRSHNVTLHDEDDTVLLCNSSHHQMMMPPESAKILATSQGTQACDGMNKWQTIDAVNEVVWFPSINALGIQPHPEWDNCPQAFIDYCSRKIKEYIL